MAKKPATATAKKVYKCKSCGETTTKKGHLCDPVELDQAYECEYCGNTATDARHICAPKVVEVKYSCANCGRVATARNLLCKPTALQKPKMSAAKAVKAKK
jgi:predicted RNA-binding Zn-ribbon protein involved in translation (DUF1610 family)